MAALREERVTVVNGGDEVEAIARALPFAPWAYHELDFI